MSTVQPKRGEIWKVNTEEGVKQCLIVSNDIGNRLSTIVLAVDVVAGKKKKPTHMQVGTEVAMFEKMATYAHQRLVKKMKTVSQKAAMKFQHCLEAVSDSFPRKRTDMSVEETSFEDIQQWGVYFVHLGEGVGSEQAGNRLVVVLSNPLLNKAGFITVIPATTKIKRKMPTHVDVPSVIGIPNDSTLLLEQMVTVKASLFRTSECIARLPKKYQHKVLRARSIATAYDIDHFFGAPKDKGDWKNA